MLQHKERSFRDDPEFIAEEDHGEVDKRDYG
jgi:hypothetical protein